MGETKTFLAQFSDIDPAVEAIDRLRQHGVKDDQMNVISGVPLTEHILGRPRIWSNVPRLALGGAVMGMLFGIFLAAGITNLYPLKIGRQGLVNGAPTVVLIFEMTMLGLLASTFIGVFLDSRFPSYRPKEYIPEISDGKIVIMYSIPEEKETEVSEVLNLLGAETITTAERRPL
ncbi:MAG: hypothetical protein A2Y88_01135 [Chloroflexi bacterium RBG_13_48_10]|nr:MAG: hypothetical protein A2Y88_01135 [Chloroflexi bacterium RBG_13_48_10]